MMRKKGASKRHWLLRNGGSHLKNVPLYSTQTSKKCFWHEKLRSFSYTSFVKNSIKRNLWPVRTERTIFQPELESAGWHSHKFPLPTTYMLKARKNEPLDHVQMGAIDRATQRLLSFPKWHHLELSDRSKKPVDCKEHHHHKKRDLWSQYKSTASQNFT